ncbi:aminoglycoside phosphotransferase family protein [Thermodesulfobacteriota bacterium]
MPDIMIEEILEEALKGRARVVRSERLEGDASDREYARLTIEPPARLGPTLIAMIMAETPGTGEIPFVDVHRHMHANSLPVPEILHVDESRGIILLEDVGDTTLQTRLKSAGVDDRRALYRQAIELLARMQVDCTRPTDPGCGAFGLAFDVDKLMWELDFFLEHAMGGLRGLRLDDADRDAITREFERLCTTLAAEPRFFTHRDYHSRNLMVQGDRLRVLDFQDARMGPLHYDLASLLRDSYVELDNDFVDWGIATYLDSIEPLLGRRLEVERFRRIFDMMSVQRNLKAVGTFAYQAVVRGIDRYLEYIPGTLSKVRLNLGKYAEFDPLREVLSRYVAEIA